MFPFFDHKKAERAIEVFLAGMPVDAVTFQKSQGANWETTVKRMSSEKQIRISAADKNTGFAIPLNKKTELLGIIFDHFTVDEDDDDDNRIAPGTHFEEFNIVSIYADGALQTIIPWTSDFPTTAVGIVEGGVVQPGDTYAFLPGSPYFDARFGCLLVVKAFSGSARLLPSKLSEHGEEFIESQLIEWIQEKELHLLD